MNAGPRFDHEGAIAMRRAGATYRQIGAQYGVSDAALSKVFRKHRVEPHSPKDAFVDDVMHWVCEGKSDEEIATILGQPKTTVSGAIARFKYRHNVRTRVQAAVLFDRMERSG